MACHDDLADQAVEVVLRIPDEDGRLDPTDRQTLEAKGRDLVFGRTPDGGVGPLKHRLAFVAWVVPLAEGRYRLDDPWIQHPFRMDEEDERAPGDLAFRDVFLARRLPDGSLLFDRVVQKANWRVDQWTLPLPVSSAAQYLTAVIARIEVNGGCIEADPWFVNFAWTFMPPDAGYDPTSDLNEAIDNIPRAEIERAMQAYQDGLGSDEEGT